MNVGTWDRSRAHSCIPYISPMHWHPPPSSPPNSLIHHHHNLYPSPPRSSFLSSLALVHSEQRNEEHVLLMHPWGKFEWSQKEEKRTGSYTLLLLLSFLHFVPRRSDLLVLPPSPLASPSVRLRGRADFMLHRGRADFMLYRRRSNAREKDQKLSDKKTATYLSGNGQIVAHGEGNAELAV